MGFTEETVRFKLDDSNKKEISETLTEVYASLNEKGYNPISQIVEIKSVNTNAMRLLKNWSATTLRDKESIYNQ